MSEIDKKIIKEINDKIKKDENYLDFLKSNTKEYTHCYHTYPAMMIPQVAREFIKTTLKYDKDVSNVFDPFMGSGTTMVEGLLNDLDVYGVDINPLSFLMTKVKTIALNPDELYTEFRTLISKIEDIHDIDNDKLLSIPKFDNINYWFKEDVIINLSKIKSQINGIKNNQIRLFFLAVFSETVRYVSNTRNNEFKLYRMAKEKLALWNPDVLDTFKNFSIRNIDGNNRYYAAIDGKEKNINIHQTSSQNLDNYYHDNSFDLLVTSPPYGDSGTTVAYGQFSRLSLQWLDLDLDFKINQLDKIMLGGKVLENIEDYLQELKSETLSYIYSKIENEDRKRAREVLQFYIDLDETLDNISKKMKKGSYQFWVVANRTVKGIKIPTDRIIIELFQKYNIEHLYSFNRNIPNKRMPKINSPTNKTGNHAVTMTKEIILMFKTNR